MTIACACHYSCTQKSLLGETTLIASLPKERVVTSVESRARMENTEEETAMISSVVDSSIDSTSGERASSEDGLDTTLTTEAEEMVLSDSQQDISTDNDVISLYMTSGKPVNEERSRCSEVVVLPEALSSETVPLAAEVPPVLQPRTAENLPLILCSLSIDSLHCIASFLAPTDWSNFGQANHATNRVCNQVFRRVRMHGFRCATEVISAWKLGQLADARELSALYTKEGVPIYPYSLGHSYHTLTWRMGIEAKEMEGREDSPEGDNESQSSDRKSRRPVDRFYTERYDIRLNDGFSSPALTYMEEKSLYWYQQEVDPSGSSGRNSRLLDVTRTSLPRPPVLQAQGPPAPVGGAGVPVRFPDFRPIGSDQSLDSQRRPSLSFGELPPTLTKKPTIRVHRHLVDQHMLGLPSVDDENGAMRTAPVSLSADFYHPHIAERKLSGLSNQPKEGSDGSDFLPASSSLPTGRTVPTIPTPPPSNEGTPAATPRRDVYDEINIVNNDDRDARVSRVTQHNPRELSPPMETQILRTPTHFGPPMLSLPQLQMQISSLPGTPPRIYHPVLSNVDIEVYSSASLPPADEDDEHVRSHLRSRFASYQHLLDLFLADRDNDGFEECILDFWDEFLPTTATVHFYDRYTAVPRVSRLHKFLTKPCPKAIGVVQCEIERIRVHPKKKGVNMKGRLFPSYEYRLFIRDRRHSAGVDNANRNLTGEPRRDTVLMTAKTRKKKSSDASEGSSSASKKGVNNYYLFTPQQSDVNAHYNEVNEENNTAVNRPNGASYRTELASEGPRNGLLGRLQSNFVGTEFQIYSHQEQKQPARPSRSFSVPHSESDNELDYDSGFSSDTMSTSSRSNRRKSLRRKTMTAKRRSSANDHPQPIDEELPSHSATHERRRTLRRAVSLPVMPYSRSSRTSRRAIANSVEPLEPHPVQYASHEAEEGAITYTANLLGNRPRIMDVCIPKVTPDGVAGAEWKRYLDSCDDANESGSSNRMLTCFKQVQSRADNPNPTDGDEENNDEDEYVPPGDFGLLALQNRPPWWNIELGAFVLNFGGRVSVASVKNFQLCDRSDQDHIMLQFGRIQGRHSFTMDFQHPLTAVQAFAVAISSLQSKISFG